MKLLFPKFERRYVYVLNIMPASGIIPFLWIGKVGFSADADIRAAEVELSIWQKTAHKVEVKRFFAVRVFWFRSIEKAIHTVLRPYQTCKFIKANGGSEMFRILNVFTGLLAYIAAYAIGIPCASWLGLCVMVLPWPLDMALCVALLALFEAVVICIIIAAAVYIIFHAYNFLNL